MPLRTFLALPLEEGIIARLSAAQRRLAEAGAAVRWVEPENLHLTVKFLGVVEDQALNEVCCVAGEVGAQVKPFEFALRGLSAVPPSGQLRMVWGGVEEPSGMLARLNDLAETAYGRLGFRRENRQFRPHLTLGRVKGGKNADRLHLAVAEFARTEFGVQSADELIVFSSQLTSDGPIYSPLATVPLGG